jgi:putative phage-type endonuclease
MSALRKMVQGSPEWHEHRSQYRNASESSIVMGLSPWMSPYQLWQLKTGKTQPAEATAPMLHGIEMEPSARAAYEAKTGAVMQPLVMISGEYSASLDGITLSGDLIVEIKCPYKGKVSELWQSVDVGEMPEMYRIQIQHQLMVSGAGTAHLWVYDGTDGLLLSVDRDEVCQQRIRKAWDEFNIYVVTDAPPPMTEQDTVIRDDTDWQVAAEDYVVLKGLAEDAASRADEAKAKLISLVRHNRESGCGVTVTRFWKTGSIDYKRVPELGSADLEQYRGKAKEEVRVTVVKQPC